MEFTQDEIAYAAYFIWGHQDDNGLPYSDAVATFNWYLAEFQLQSTAQFMQNHPEIEKWQFIFIGDNAIAFYQVDELGDPIGEPVEVFTKDM